MKKVQLTKGYTTLVSNTDYKRVIKHTWKAHEARRKDGSIKNVYAVRNLPRTNGKRLDQKLHRFILGIIDPKIHVDHKDRDGLNNQRGNLRVSQNKNSQNSKLKSNNTSGFKGVYWNKPACVWIARIYFEGKRIHLGCFLKATDAAKAYDRVAVKYFGKFACTNKILGLL